jgi:CHAT domain-containing protein
VLSGDLRDYRILHFATHAVADTQHPELSGLVLSQVDAEGKPQEGFVSLPDIYDLDLNADLVVLSGCRTALGKEVRGEGLMGLTRGFQYAGAPRVVASLWQVQDRATAELMTRFYRAMWRDHLPPAAALRKAQRSLRRDPRYRGPYSWAGFVIQGDWR